MELGCLLVFLVLFEAFSLLTTALHYVNSKSIMFQKLKPKLHKINMVESLSIGTLTPCIILAECCRDGVLLSSSRTAAYIAAATVCAP